MFLPAQASLLSMNFSCFVEDFGLLLFFIQQMLVLSLCKSCCFHWPCNSLLILGLRFVLPDLGTRIKQFKLTNLARNKLLSKIAILG